MQAQKTTLDETHIKLILTADQELLENSRQEILRKLRGSVKIPGFRAGKVPLELVEKNVDQSALQDEFLNAVLNKMYAAALDKEKVRPVAQPQVSIKKFVPYTTLEFEAEVEVMGDVTLPDYTKIKLARQNVETTDADVDEVIENLRLRSAEKKEVDRASKDKDEVWIDFVGRDAKTNEPIKGADGKDYPLALGSDTFIPGFEKNLVGAKPAEEREFTLTFPKDYGVAALQGRKVIFTVTVTQVKEVVLPKVDDAFAAQAGPFKTIEDLKSDIRKQLQADRQMQADREFESELLGKITDGATVAVPKTLVDEELERLEQEERRNVTYRGQTWEEHLETEGVTAEEHKEKNRPTAEKRVKSGLVLAEIAEKEKIDVNREELELRLQLLKGQYQDPSMQAEIDKPENRREIASRLVSEKTLAILAGYADKGSKPTKK